MPEPKAFISYSWSNPEHEDWVLNLATDLRESGVDAILDKWDLKEGHEANAFMEKMVSDPEIQKVIIVSDKMYVEKSNTRAGGAGTEAQIISSEIYKKQDQNKFAVLVAEKDEEGKPYIPAYYSSRIFIDFTDTSKFTDSFEQLLRWVFDKPIHKKPDLGEQPSYLSENENTIHLATDAAFRRAQDALVNDRVHALPATQDYLELFTKELEKFRFADELDLLGNEIMDNFSNFIPYRNQVIELFGVISRYSEKKQYGDQIHAFFERLIPYFSPKPDTHSYGEVDFDNFKFFAHELFLYALTIFIKERREDLYLSLVENQYYDISRAERGGQTLHRYDIFRSHLKLLTHRNKELKLERFSVHADMLKERSVGSGFDFRDLMQTDFILYLRYELVVNLEYYHWYPETLVYAKHHDSAFELFDRAQSMRDFEGLKKLLGIESKAPLDKLIQEYAIGTKDIIKFGPFNRLSPSSLSGYDNLCTMP